MNKKVTLRTGFRLMLCLFGMVVCMSRMVMRASAASEQSKNDEKGVSANTETEAATSESKMIAGGDCWVLDADGCLHIVGNVSNTSYYEPGVSLYDGTPWAAYKSRIVSVDVAPGTVIDNCAALFNDCTNLKTVDLTNLDTEYVSDMSFMFAFCKSLETVNLDMLSMSNVCSMDSMFYFCTNLQEMNLNSWDTSSVGNMDCMFSGCESIKTIELDKIDTQYLNSMRGMFERCDSLESLNLSNFLTFGVTNMKEVFAGCKSLTELDLGNFDTSNVTNMFEMFAKCEKLQKVNLSSFDTSQVKNMKYMFEACRSLEFLDISNFMLNDECEMDLMFSGCKSLKELDISGFNNSNHPKVRSVFWKCDNLSYIELHSEFLALIAEDVMRLTPQWYCMTNGKVYSDAESLTKLSGKVKLYANTCAIESATSAWEGITLKWSNPEGKKMTVYRMADGNPEWEVLATVSGSGYYDKDTYNGTEYAYVLLYEDQTFTRQGSVMRKRYVPSPKIQSVENRSGSVKVTWGPEHMAEGYFVYRKETRNGTWHMIGSTKKNLYFIDDTVENGVVYYYAVKSFVKDRETSEYCMSASSSAVNTIYVKNNFISEMTEPNPGTLQVKYTKTAECSGYEVVYGTDEALTDGVTVTVPNPATAIVRIPDLTAGGTYYAKVRAYKTVAGYTFFSNWSAVKNLTLEP